MDEGKVQAAVMSPASGFPYDDEAQRGFAVVFLRSNVSSTGIFPVYLVSNPEFSPAPSRAVRQSRLSETLSVYEGCVSKLFVI